MSEGNHVARDAAPDESPKIQSTHSPASGSTAFQTRKALMIAAGTGVCVLVAGLAFQAFTSSSSGTAAEQPAPGRVQLAPQPKSASAAVVTRDGRSIQIPLKDLYERCAMRVGNEVLDSMINRAVIQLACEGAGVVVTQAEVEQEITRIAKQFNIPVTTWLQMLESERKITPEQYSTDVIWPMLALKKLAGDNVEVTEEDMHKAFVRNFGSRVEIKMIMLDNHRRANEVWQKASLNPNDFDRLAREHSIDPTSRAMNGAVPPVARYSGNPKIEQAAFNLKPGEISGIIQYGHGSFVILKCEGFTEQIVQSIDEVREQLHTDLVEEKVQEGVATLFEDLKKTSTVDNFWNHTRTGNISQVSGQVQPGFNNVRPAAATQPATGIPPRR
ncbi:MAG: peptidylprolyl isomerase [Rhodopirellula sp.]|nr:peptidylprolyl isomerase [Rhodopirellula sp.]